MNRLFHKSILPGVVFVLSVLISACGSGGVDSSSPASSGVVSAQVTSIGTILELTATSGARLKLTIPANALLLPTAVTLKETTPLNGAVTTFTISPAGTLLNVPATLEITLPAQLDPGATVGAWFGPSDDRTALPGEYVASARTYTLQTWFLGYTSIEAPLASIVVAAVNDAPSGSDFINVGALSCDIELTSLGDRIEHAKLFAFSGESVSQLISQFEVTRTLCETPDNDDFTAQAAALKTLSCNEYNSAVTSAQVLVGATSADELAAQLQPIIGTAALVSAVGAECGSAPNLGSVLGPEFSDFVSNYTAEVSAPGFLSTSSIWRQAWGQLVRAVSIAATAQMLGLEDGEQKVYDELLPAMLDQLRGAAYAACRGDFNEERYLADMYTGGWLFAHPVVGEPELPPWTNFSAAELRRDIHLCGAKLNAKAYYAATDIAMDEKNLGGGATPESHNDTATMTVPADGAIDLLGPIHDFTCTPGSGSATPENATVTIFANDRALGTASLQGASLQTVPFPVSIGAALRSLGLPEKDGQQFNLRLVRNGSGCGGSHGDGDFELFRIGVTTGLPAAQIAGTWHGQWSGTYTGTVVLIGGEWEVTFTQSGSVLNGTLTVVIATSTPVRTCGGEVSGIVVGNTFQFATASSSCGSASWDGNFTWDGNYNKDAPTPLGGTWLTMISSGAFGGSSGPIPPEED